MKRNLLAFLALLCLAPSGACAATSPAKPAATPPPANVQTVPAPPPGGFLPDTTLLARVDDRIIRVLDFRDRYFGSDALTRPAGDSLGRVEFLNNMVNKEVMGLTALAIERPLDFQDRVQLRQFTRTALQNVLYQRQVGDSIQVTEAEVRAVYPQYSRQLHLRRILFSSRATAARVRRDLLAGRIDWKKAVESYSLERLPGGEGDLGWISRGTLKGEIALKAFDLQPGSISQVLHDIEGYHLLQCVGRKAVDPPAYPAVRRLLYNDVREAKRTPLVDRFYQRIRERAGVTYDSTNIEWVAGQFKKRYDQMGRPVGVNLTGMAPAIDEADTSRVLARTRERRFTLGEFMDGFNQIPAYLQKPLISADPVIFTIDGMFLEPEFVKLAHSLGIDRDPKAAAMIDNFREELLVEHLYGDSVLSHVSVTPEMRQRYYREHQKEFVSIARARFAELYRETQASAESLVARLRAGESVEAILRADSQRGVAGEGIRETQENNPGPYVQILFVDLKPGKVTYAGADATGRHVVLKLLEREDSRPMSYDEVQSLVDESVQNIESERLLKALLARHRTQYHIEMHPELVMRVRLTDPVLDFDLD